MSSTIKKLAPPALPFPTPEYDQMAETGHISIIRLFFNTLTSGFNHVVDDMETVSRPTIKTVTTTTYTLTGDDESSLILFTNASGCTVTGPVDTTEELPNGYIAHLHQESAGQVTFVAEAGATSVSAVGLNTRVQYSSLSIIVQALNTYKVIGDATP